MYWRKISRSLNQTWLCFWGAYLYFLSLLAALESVTQTSAFCTPTMKQERTGDDETSTSVKKRRKRRIDFVSGFQPLSVLMYNAQWWFMQHSLSHACMSFATTRLWIAVFNYFSVGRVGRSHHLYYSTSADTWVSMKEAMHVDCLPSPYTEAHGCSQSMWWTDANPIGHWFLVVVYTVTCQFNAMWLHVLLNVWCHFRDIIFWMFRAV